MSELRTALNGASFQGYVDVTELGPQGMITLRGDLSGEEMGAAIQVILGAEIPDQRGRTSGTDCEIAWMSPDELMVLCEYRAAPGIAAQLTEALAGTHHLVAVVSDARAMFRLSGDGAGEVLAKLAPVDISPDAFSRHEIRRTRLAQIPAAFWQSGDKEYDLVCFRSNAQYAFDLLKNASRPGSQVNAY